VLFSVAVLVMVEWRAAGISSNKASSRRNSCQWLLSSSSADHGGGESRDGVDWPTRSCCLVAPSPLVLTHGTRGSPRFVPGEHLRWEFAVVTTMDGGPLDNCVVVVSYICMFDVVPLLSDRPGWRG
jgi:hypothetical protein